MRKTTAEPIGEVLKGVVEKLNQAKKKDIFKIISVWPAVVGKEFARHTKPASLRKGTLMVFVDESAWLYQATLQKEKLFQALQKKIAAHQVRNIQFRIGKI